MTTGSVIIVTYGQWGHTERCLRSLEVALGEELGRSWEIIVVDNNSPDETPRRLAGWSDRVRVELLDQNLNFAGGCNHGAKLANGTTLVFLNNDTVVPAGLLEEMAAQTRQPGIAAAGCRLLFPDGTIQHAGVAFYRNPNLADLPMPQHVFHHHAGEIAATRAVFETDSVTAAFFAVRRDAFAEVGGFETGYVNGLEDIDLCLKLRTAGHGIVFRGDLETIHYEGSTRGKGTDLFATEAKLATMVKNDRLFTGRWSAHLEQDDEVASLVWDAELRDHPLPRDAPADSNVLLVGQSTGVGPGAAEARALLVGLHSLGLRPAAIDLPHPNVAARLTGSVAQIVERAMRTPPVLNVPVFCVPAGPSDTLWQPNGQVTPGDDTFIRLAAAGTALSLHAKPRLLPASSAVAAELISDGMEPRLVTVIPPLVEPRVAGGGGGGVLVVLPTHDPVLTTDILAALRTMERPAHIRIIPTAFHRDLADRLRDSLPGAELLGPCSDEARFASLAADADVLLDGDTADRFQRSVLIAASAGATPLTLRPDGPLVDALGPETVSELPELARRLSATLAEPRDRNALAATMNSRYRQALSALRECLLQRV